MNIMMHRISDAARKRSAYRRTLFELKSMPLSTAIDLGLFHEDFDAMAKDAVYGR